MPRVTRSVAPIGLSVLLMAGTVLPAGAQEDVDAAVGREGSLRNTTPFPSDPNAVEALRRGDEAWEAYRDADDAADRNTAFDAWAEALALSPNSAAVPALDPGAPEGLWRDSDGTLGRRGEGVAEAVLRRLEELTAADRRAWTERAALRAEPELAAVGRLRGPAAASEVGALRATLARIERHFPATESAAIAALRSADLALERGEFAGASVWIERAERHALLAGFRADGWSRALEARRAWLGSARGVAPAAPAPASRLVHREVLRLEGRRASSLAQLGRNVQPGLVELNDGSLLVQTPRSIVVLDPNAARGESGGDVVREGLEAFLGSAGQPAARIPTTTPSAGGWPLLPATDGSRVAFVVGRGQPGRRFRDLPLPARGNVLAVLERDESGRARLVWSLGDLGLRQGWTEEAPPRGAGLGPDGGAWQQGWEFQPGPLVADGAVFVLARRLADPTEPEDAGAIDAVPANTLRVMALELATGELRWALDLTRAAELGDEARRGAPGLGIATSAAPLALARGRLLVQTNVGLLASIAVDGRIEWVFRNQRRTPSLDGGWPGSRAPIALGDGGSAWFAPFDSDFAYRLPVTARPAGGSGWLVATPHPREGALDLVGVEPDGALIVAAQVARFAGLERRSLDGAARPLALLSEAERLAGRAALRGRQLLVASDRYLRVLDLDQGGLLAASAPLEEARGAPLGGDVSTSGNLVRVLGADALWILSFE